MPCVLNPRKLAAIDLALLGPKVIISEFIIGVFLSAALGVFVLLRGHAQARQTPRAQGQFSLAHVYKNAFHFWSAVETKIEVPGNYVPTGVEHAFENAILVAEAAMRWFDYDDAPSQRNLRSRLRHNGSIFALRSKVHVENEFSDRRTLTL